MALSFHAGITQLSCLLELYAASNRLAGLGCLLGMTSLRSLMVLDVTGNPLASEEQHLLRTVYFLPFLKVPPPLPQQRGLTEDELQRTFGRCWTGLL